MSKISLLKKGFEYLKQNGIKNTLTMVLERRGGGADEKYAKWYESSRLLDAELDLQRKQDFDTTPRISILVPMYNTPKKFIEKMIGSLKNQTYGNWELCIANASPDNKEMADILRSYCEQDDRICTIDVPENEGISQNTNKAFKIASGEYIGLLDHDDELTCDALFEVIKAINENPDTEVIYSDEDKIDEDSSRVFKPHFKPDFNPELLRSNNYITHFFVLRAQLMKEIGGFRARFNGAQDYDLILRAVEKADFIYHIPKVLYHWRVHASSTAENPFSKMYAYTAGENAIKEHLERMNESGTVSEAMNKGFYNVKYEVTDHPKVLIIINGDDAYASYIKRKAGYANCEVIKSTEIKLTVMHGIISHFNAEYIISIGKDVKIETSDFVQVLLSVCMRKSVGVAGARISSKSRLVHAGMTIGEDKIRYLFKGLNKDYSGYMHRASLQMDVAAVSPAFMMFKSEFVMNDNLFKINDNQINWPISHLTGMEICLKARERGLFVVYCPFVEADVIEELPEFSAEDINRLKENWKDVLSKPDPYYNTNLDLVDIGY